MALEYLEHDYFTLKSDVWSFGVLVWEMFSFGKSPYGPCSFDEVLEKLANGYRLLFPKGLEKNTTWSPEELYQLYWAITKTVRTLRTRKKFKSKYSKLSYNIHILSLIHI